MDVPPTGHHLTAASSRVNCQYTMGFAVLTAMQINTVVLRYVTPRSLVPYAALHADSCPFSHIGDPGSVPQESIWNLWWEKWYWVTFRYQHFDCTLSITTPPTLHSRSYCLVDGQYYQWRQLHKKPSDPATRIKMKFRYAGLTVSYDKLNLYSTVNWLFLASNRRTVVICKVPRKGSLTSSHVCLNEIIIAQNWQSTSVPDTS
jgi:hypothetical protein